MASNENEKPLSLLGSVSLGTGVMIGAGIHAPVGQVSERAVAASQDPVARRGEHAAKC